MSVEEFGWVSEEMDRGEVLDKHLVGREVTGAQSDIDKLPVTMYTYSIPLMVDNITDWITGKVVDIFQEAWDPGTLNAGKTATVFCLS